MTQKHHIMHGRDHSPGGSDPLGSSGAASGDVLSADGSGGIQWAPGGGGGGVNDPWIRHVFYKSASCVYNAAAQSYYMTWNPTPVHKYDGAPADPWITLNANGRDFTLINTCIIEFVVWLNPGFYIVVPAGNDKSQVQWRASWDVWGYDGASSTQSPVGAGLITHWEWAGSYDGSPHPDTNRPLVRGSAIVSRVSLATTGPYVSVAGGFEGDPAWLQGQTPTWTGFLLAKKLSPW